MVIGGLTLQEWVILAAILGLKITLACAVIGGTVWAVRALRRRA